MIEKKRKASKAAPKDARNVKARPASKTEAPKRKKKPKATEARPETHPSTTDAPKVTSEPKTEANTLDEPLIIVSNAPTIEQRQTTQQYQPPTIQEMARHYLDHSAAYHTSILSWKSPDPNRWCTMEYAVIPMHPEVFFGDNARLAALGNLHLAATWFDRAERVYATAPRGERRHHERIQQMSTILRALMLCYAKEDAPTLREFEKMAIRWESKNQGSKLQWPPIETWPVEPKKKGDLVAEKAYAHSVVHDDLCAGAKHFAERPHAVIAKETATRLGLPILCLLIRIFKDDLPADVNDFGRQTVENSILATLQTQQIGKWGEPDFARSVLRNAAKKLGIKDKTAEEMFRYSAKREDRRQEMDSTDDE